MEGLPLGTRGGLSIRHYFPLDGEYVIRVRLWRATADAIKGLEDLHQVEISIDGNRVKLATIGGKDEAELSYTNSGKSALEIDARLTVHVPVKAGPRTVVATFMAEGESQDDNILQPFERANLDPLDFRGLPAVDRVSITGPLNSTGPGDTPSRRLIFVCRPTSHTDEVPCAKKIIGTLARRAYRRPVSDNDLETLLSFYQKGRNEGGTFDSGIEAAIQLILASPEFLFRFEPDPPALAAGAVYHISDLELASRLSFFLWSTGPDDQLLNLAALGKLKDPAVLDSQVKRMLADPKSKALVDNFADQWLYLRNLKNINPDFETFPDFDDNLRQAMRQRDRSVLQQHHPGRPQHFRSSERELHLHRRAAGAALRHSERLRNRLPPRAHHRRTAQGFAGAGQHFDHYVLRDAHFAGAARQVDPDQSDRHAARSAAAQCSGVEGTRRSRAKLLRCASAWKSTARIRPARAAIS